MSDVPYFKPPEEGPLFPDESAQLMEDVETFLRASNRDVRDEVARQNIHDLSQDSFKLFASEKLKELGIEPPKSEE